MAATAQLIHGEALMVDHTPSSAVTAGDVLVIGDSIRIAHLDIAANALGELAAGGAVYDVPKADGVGSAFVDGDTVYWDAGDGVASNSDDTASNLQMGLAVGAAADAATTVRVQHVPN